MTREGARVGARVGSRGQNGLSKRAEKVVSNHEFGYNTRQPSETPRSHRSTIAAASNTQPKKAAASNTQPTTAAVASNTQLTIATAASNTQLTTPAIVPNTQPTTTLIAPNTEPTTAPNTQPIVEQANNEPTTTIVQTNNVGRGANASKDAPENPKDREVIQIIGDRFQPNFVVRQIVCSIKNQMGPYPTWLSVAKELKNNRKAKKVWDHVLSTRYKDLMKKARDEPKRKKGLPTYNFEKMAEYPPSFMKKEYWVSLCEGCNKKTWRKISNSGSTSRTKGGKLNHVGGSIPFISHAKRLENEKKTKPTHIEVFDLIHKKDGVYCNDKARRVGEKYKSDVTEKYGENFPTFDLDIWKEAAGGIKKGRLFGFGGDLKAT